MCVVTRLCAFVAGVAKPVVFYSQDGEKVAVSVINPGQKAVHGKPVPHGFKVVQITWVRNTRVPAPLVLRTQM